MVDYFEAFRTSFLKKLKIECGSEIIGRESFSRNFGLEVKYGVVYGYDLERMWI